MDDIGNLIEKRNLQRAHTTEEIVDDTETSLTENAYIFDTKLYKLKEFCEQHINIYVKEIINPKDELDFYIQQSWLTVNSPGENLPAHHHSNSILSGTFYVSTVENDRLHFYDVFQNLKSRISIEEKESNIWNASTWFFPVEDNDLILFPSWLDHGVQRNPTATKDRISIAFNVFAKGIFGRTDKKHY
jgi:uncharacterized protein (TIGR02466 family)